MPVDSIEKLRKMPSIEDRLSTMSQRRRGAVKLGDTTSHYVYVDSEEVRMKTDGVGAIMHKDKTVIQPGANLSFQVPYQRTDFNGLAFHPLSEQPSTAANPHATFIPSVLDPDIKIVEGIYSVLENLRKLI